MTERQQRILQWLNKAHPHEGRLFQSALMLWEDERIPCRARLVAHSFRELSTGLVNAYSKSNRVNIDNLLDSVAKNFDALNLELDRGTGLQPVPKPRANEPISVPRGFLLTVSRLVGEHRAELRGPTRVQALLDGKRLRRAASEARELTPTALRWHEAARFFVGVCHDKNSEDAQLLGEEFRSHVEFLEGTLISLAEGAVADLDALDKLLEEANS